MREFLCVCCGGALGSGARYLLGLLTTSILGGGFPYGTLLVNALGSLLIGVFLAPGFAPVASSPPLRLFLATGLMGGFTTYSTFNYETLRLFQQGQSVSAFVYLLATVVICLGTGLLGVTLARQLFS